MDPERELVAMKRSYKEPQDGDVFIVQPTKGVYYYGKVIQANLDSKANSFFGWHLIYIYDFWTKEIRVGVKLDGVPLLIAPMVVNKRPWTMGYIETIYNSSVTDYDRSIHYGFWDVLRKKFYDLQGNVLSQVPKYSGTYGLGSYGAIGYEIHKVLDGEKDSISSDFRLR